MSKSLNFLILATGQPTKHLIEAITKQGHTYEVHEPKDLYLYIDQSETGKDMIYNGANHLEKPVQLKTESYDAVISAIGANLAHGASILRHLTENLGIYCAQTATGLETASNKLKTTQRLSTNGITVPPTVYASELTHIPFLIEKVGGLPAVAKLLQGSQGVGVFLLETPQATNTALESMYKLKVPLKIQGFVDGKNKDIRAIVVGDKVAVAMERTANQGSFRANISQGGSGRKIELSDADKKMCVEAARAVDLRYAGVDLMKDDKGNSYIIEVNGNPGTKIVSITGYNHYTDLVAFIAGRVSQIKAKEGGDGKGRQAEANVPGGMIQATNVHTKESRMMTAQEYSSLQFDGWTANPQQTSSIKAIDPSEKLVEAWDYYSGETVTMTEFELRQHESNGGHYFRVKKES